jgi:hypothetical protein
VAFICHCGVANQKAYNSSALGEGKLEFPATGADRQVVAISFEPADKFFRAREAAVKAATVELDEKERREYLDIGPRQSGNVAEALSWFGISLSDSVTAGEHEIAYINRVVRLLLSLATYAWQPPNHMKHELGYMQGLEMGSSECIMSNMLLVNAARARGIPARSFWGDQVDVAGKKGSGYHSQSEIWLSSPGCWVYTEATPGMVYHSFPGTAGLSSPTPPTPDKRDNFNCKFYADRHRCIPSQEDVDQCVAFFGKAPSDRVWASSTGPPADLLQQWKTSFAAQIPRTRHSWTWTSFRIY